MEYTWKVSYTFCDRLNDDKGTIYDGTTEVDADNIIDAMRIAQIAIPKGARIYDIGVI